MAKQSKMWLKLGDKASGFYCPTTEVKVLPNKIVEISTITQMSKKIRAAIGGGHLIQVTEQDFKDANKVAKESKPTDDGDNKPVILNELTIPKLLKVIEADYELDAAEWEKVKKLKKPELIEYIEKLEKEAE